MVINVCGQYNDGLLPDNILVELPSFCPYSQCSQWVSTFKSVCVCACVHRDWCFEAFVDVKIPGAGDDLLSSAAGKPRYVQLKRLR